MGVFILETLSVILQVIWIRLFKRKLFLMTPLHHHFELTGWPETKVVAIFAIVTAVLCLIGLVAL